MKVCSIKNQVIALWAKVDQKPFFQPSLMSFLWVLIKSTLSHDLKTYFIFFVCQFFAILCIFQHKNKKNI